MNFFDKFQRRVFYSHIRKEEAGLDVCSYLARRFKRFSFLEWREQALARHVLINDLNAAPDDLLHEHDRVSWLPGDLPEPSADLRFQTVYEDDDLLVFNKSGNLCVHPTGPFFRNTLWHLAGERYGEIRFVNRLDRETSGLLAAVRTPGAAAVLTNRNTPMYKEYLSVVFGHFKGSVHAHGFLIPDTNSCISKKKRFVEHSVSGGESADTEITEVAPVGEDMTLIRVIPHTGRQHQIRATLFSLGFPLVGDKLYGPDERVFLKLPSQTITEDDYALLRMRRQALHSAVLEFPHPVTGKTIRCEAPLPADFPCESLSASLSMK